MPVATKEIQGNQTSIDQWWTWAYAVLNGIGAPTSPTNINTLWNWSIKESGRNPLSNGSIHNNPLNTTQPAPGSVSANSVGVQSFPDVSTGASATVQTLLNGYYPAIVSALRNSEPTSQWGSNPTIISELGKWGSGSNWLSWNNQAPTPSINFQNTSVVSSAVSGATNDVQSAINAALGPVGSAITNATSTFAEKLTYGGLIAVGALLMLAGFGILALPLIGSAAVKATPQGRVAGAAIGAAKSAEAPKSQSNPAGNPNITNKQRTSRLREYGADEGLETRQDGRPTGKLRPSVREKIRRNE